MRRTRQKKKFHINFDKKMKLTNKRTRRGGGVNQLEPGARTLLKKLKDEEKELVNCIEPLVTKIKSLKERQKQHENRFLDQDILAKLRKYTESEMRSLAEHLNLHSGLLTSIKKIRNDLKSILTNQGMNPEQREEAASAAAKAVVRSQTERSQASARLRAAARQANAEEAARVAARARAETERAETAELALLEAADEMSAQAARQDKTRARMDEQMVNAAMHASKIAAIVSQYGMNAKKIAEYLEPSELTNEDELELLELDKMPDPSAPVNMLKQVDSNYALSRAAALAAAVRAAAVRGKKKRSKRKIRRRNKTKAKKNNSLINYI
jgi:hypothetical protein